MFSLIRKKKFKSIPNVVNLLLVRPIQSLNINKKYENRGSNQLEILNNNKRHSLHQQAPPIRTLITDEDKSNFMAIYPRIVADLKSAATEFDAMYAPDWFERAIKYNLKCGKKNRGQLTVLAFKELANKSQLTSENIERAQLLGWCVEVLVGSILALDDIVDNSISRRMQPCWYKVEDVGLQAINDAMMMENSWFFILKKYFGDCDYYMKMLELFRKITFITSIGQILDLQASKENVTTFTLERYESLVRIKTSYGTLNLPVQIAMLMCGIEDPSVFARTEKILFEIAYYFQTQNDFEDCFGDPKVTGRIGTDIEENRCTWLSATCMERASPKQRKIMQENYGHKDPAKVLRVREIYDELDLVSLYAAFEDEAYRKMERKITTLDKDIPADLFHKIWKVFYRKVTFSSFSLD